MLHQFICSQEQIDLTVDGIVYKPQKSDHSGHFLLCLLKVPLGGPGVPLGGSRGIHEKF